MTRESSPKDCCDYERCTQGRHCPVRSQLHTQKGGARIDTETDLDSVYRWVDLLYISLRLSLLALSAGCVVMFLFHSFN